MLFLRSIFVVVLTVGLGRAAIVRGPVNDAFEPGPMVTLNCNASGPAGTVRVAWYESITNPNWAVISDNGGIISGHPNAARYSLNYDGISEFDLSIFPTVLGDGGAYRCVDVFDSQTGLGAQLITIAGAPNCTSNIPASGYVREGQYYSMECEIFYQGNVAPTMTWTGPDPFLTAVVTTNTTVTAGVAFNATRFQSGYPFRLLTNFTQAGFIQPNYASNVPTWSNVQTSPSLIVQWEPKGMYIVPEQPTYNVGDTIECHADANPAATFFWQNIETGERWEDFRLYCSDQLVGTQRMRCNAANNITGTPYTADYFFNLTVNARTTTPVPTTTTTTTPPLPDTDCDDLTGRWQASSPNIIDMCLEVNNTDRGRIIGIMRNATDPYFIEIRGRIAPNNYNQIGLTGVWPTAIGAVTMIGTCRKCYGIEFLQFNGLSRTTIDNTGCTDFGAVRYAPMYLFSRVGPPCRGLKAHLLSPSS